jgi:hypothetical protein
LRDFEIGCTLEYICVAIEEAAEMEAGILPFTFLSLVFL